LSPSASTVMTPSPLSICTMESRSPSSIDLSIQRTLCCQNVSKADQASHSAPHRFLPSEVNASERPRPNCQDAKMGSSLGLCM